LKHFSVGVLFSVVISEFPSELLFGSAVVVVGGSGQPKNSLGVLFCNKRFLLFLNRIEK
jgi:hypothetical protein